MSKRDIALDLYNSFKGNKRTFFNKPTKESTELNSRNDEPTPVGELINELVENRDWKSGLAEGEVFVKPLEVKNSKLFIKCSSSAWATQLNLVKRQLLESIQKIAPAISELEILGPNAPSWRKGLRTIQGAKGPRDTYG
jgi:predicted nucleic acid-binding Zn ribbon protein